MDKNIVSKKIELFEEKINDYLKNYNDNSHNFLECYIMKNEYKTILSKSSSRKNLISSEKGINQYFIDNFNDAIKYLEKGGYFKYTNKEIMELFKDKNDLNKIHNISYVYILKNKIIIDFNENVDLYKAILIIPAHRKNVKNEKIFIISDDNKSNNKENLFKSLLKEDANDLSDVKKIKNKYKNYLEEIDDYLNNIKNNKGRYKYECDNILYDGKIIKRIKQQIEILILIYYYEKLVENNDMPNYIQYSYYIVNSEWIEKYKKYYYYNDLSELLNKEKNNNNINFNIIESCKNEIIEKYFKEYIKIVPQNILLNIGFKKNPKDIQAELLKVKNLCYYNECYIIPGKIFDLIIKLEYNKNPSGLKIYSKEILSYNGNILINIYSTNTEPIILNLGDMKGLLFNIKYIISYFSQKDYNDFKNKSIIQYFSQNSCNEKLNEIQIMKNSDKIIGILLVLNPDLMNMKYQGKIFNQRTKLINSQSHGKLYSKKLNYTFNSRKYSYRNKIRGNNGQQLILLNKTIEIKSNKKKGTKLYEDNKDKDLNIQRQKFIEEYNNKEKKIIDENNNKEKDLNIQKQKLIEEYNNKEKKIIDEYNKKEKDLNIELKNITIKRKK